MQPTYQRPDWFRVAKLDPSIRPTLQARTLAGAIWAVGDRIRTVSRLLCVEFSIRQFERVEFSNARGCSFVLNLEEPRGPGTQEESGPITRRPRFSAERRWRTGSRSVSEGSLVCCAGFGTYVVMASQAPPRILPTGIIRPALPARGSARELVPIFAEQAPSLWLIDSVRPRSVFDSSPRPALADGERPLSRRYRRAS